MTRYVFDEVRLSTSKSVRCSRCGKTVRRSRTFIRTENPFNEASLRFEDCSHHVCRRNARVLSAAIGTVALPDAVAARDHGYQAGWAAAIAHVRKSLPAIVRAGGDTVAATIAGTLDSALAGPAAAADRHE